jgi:thioredoxin-like negative regulator of GroEL
LPITTRWSSTASLLGAVPARPSRLSWSSTFHPYYCPQLIKTKLTTRVRLSNEEAFKDVHFIKVDVDETPDVAQELGVKAMPTFYFFRNGEKVDDLMGANPQGLEEKAYRLLA